MLELRCRTLVSGSHPLVPRSNQWRVELVDMVLLKISRPAPCNRLWMYEVRAFLRLAEAVDMLCSSEQRATISAPELSRTRYCRSCTVYIHISPSVDVSKVELQREDQSLQTHQAFHRQPAEKP